MKHILIFLTALLIISCSKDDETITSQGTKLISIDYLEENKNWKENYLYDSNNKIYEVKNLYSLGRRYEIEYSDEKLKQYTTYRISDNKKIFRDSILYNSNGNIEKIYNFSINSGEILPLTWIYEFEYDNFGKLYKKSTYFKSTEEYTRFEKYYWNGQNIERIEEYNETEELYYEYFFTYDDKVNYKRNIPIFISDPINWSANNVTIMNWNDYYGNLDIICRPCESTYKYNLDQLPIKIETNWGRKLELRYE